MMKYKLDCEAEELTNFNGFLLHIFSLSERSGVSWVT
jgi:hypothetical protein